MYNSNLKLYIKLVVLFMRLVVGMDGTAAQHQLIVVAELPLHLISGRVLCYFALLDAKLIVNVEKCTLCPLAVDLVEAEGR